MRFNCAEDIIALTPQWKGERFPDGGIPYRSLDWSVEYDLAINGDPNDTQTAL